jgi:hypothetical protein
LALLTAEQKPLLFCIEYSLLDEMKQTRRKLLLIAENQQE